MDKATLPLSYIYRFALHCVPDEHVFHVSSLYALHYNKMPGPCRAAESFLVPYMLIWPGRTDMFCQCCRPDPFLAIRNALHTLKTPRVPGPRVRTHGDGHVMYDFTVDARGSATLS
jgi:hypothetical protein